MSRHIQWGLLLFLTFLIGVAATSPIWLPMSEPFLGSPEVEVVFQCPENLEAEICEALTDLNTEDEAAAELMVEVIAAGPVPAPADEQERESISEGIDPTTLSSFIQTEVRVGEFTGVDVLRSAEGRVTLWELVADGDITRVLRFDGNFSTTPGPDLRVILSAHPNPETIEDMNLGELQVVVGGLKGNLGSQNYTLDPELDITAFGSVVIYSEALQRIWGVAPLQQPVQ